MSIKEPRHPLYIAFLAVMVLMLLIGLFLLIYGSLHNGIPMPSLPGDLLRAQAARLFHG